MADEKVTSGYGHCPCCGADTVFNDITIPELCCLCEDADCQEDGEGYCNVPEPEDMDLHNWRGE